ncbi:MAG: hypothetical protein ACYC4R_17270 [Anaerolineae bacterium]
MTSTTLRSEHGLSLPLVLILLAVAILLVSPLAARTRGGYAVTERVETTLHQQYASDAGAEYGLWRLLQDESFRSGFTVEGQAATFEAPASINGVTTTITVTLADLQQGGGSGGEDEEPPYWPYVLWAQSKSSSKAMEFSGNSHYIDGDIHSNSGISVGGNNHAVTGVCEYAPTYPFNPKKGSFPNREAVTPSDKVWNDLLDMWSVSQFNDPTKPGTWAHLAASQGQYHTYPSLHVSGSDDLEPGLYYVSGDVSISGAGHIFNGVTIVAGGEVSISANGAQFTPYVTNLTLMAFSTTGKKDIKLSSTNISYGGACFAPYGDIEMTGSGHVIGAFLGQTVYIGGNGGGSGEPLTLHPLSSCGVFEILSSAGGTTTHVWVTECGEGELETLSWSIE